MLGRPRHRQGDAVDQPRACRHRYDLHETRGKTANARRRIDLDPTTIAVLGAWRAWQTTEQQAIGIEPSTRMFTDGHGEAIHPHAIQ